jgi:quercetin dioxygenase-like cupin family protein
MRKLHYLTAASLAGPAVKHWHGATATNGMSHIAITEALNGKNVDWLEEVSDAEYTR